MDFLDLPAVKTARGTVHLPGSKSISNRVLLLAALADGATEIRDVLVSDDTARMLDALQTLGVPIVKANDRVYRIQGISGHFPLQFPVGKASLFLGNAGTAFRPLTAVLALAGGSYQLAGTARMHERPIGDLVDALVIAFDDRALRRQEHEHRAFGAFQHFERLLFAVDVR